MGDVQQWRFTVYAVLLSVFVLSVVPWLALADLFTRMAVYVGLVVVFLNIDFYLAHRGGGFVGAWAVFLVLALLSASVLYGVGLGIGYFVSYSILIALWLRLFPGVTASLRNADWRYAVVAAFLSVFVLGFLGFDGASMVVLSPLWELLVQRSLCRGDHLAGCIASSLFSSSTLVAYPAVLIYAALTSVFKRRAGIDPGALLALDVVLRTCVAAGWALWM